MGAACVGPDCSKHRPAHCTWFAALSCWAGPAPDPAGRAVPRRAPRRAPALALVPLGCGFLCCPPINVLPPHQEQAAICTPIHQHHSPWQRLLSGLYLHLRSPRPLLVSPVTRGDPQPAPKRAQGSKDASKPGEKQGGPVQVSAQMHTFNPGIVLDVSC